jgi:hypothetical protein
MKTISMGKGVCLSTPILSQDEAAAYLGISSRTFRKLDVPRHLISGNPRYDSRELDEWVKGKDE